jgi:hypothetical protein
VCKYEFHVRKNDMPINLMLVFMLSILMPAHAKDVIEKSIKEQLPVPAQPTYEKLFRKPWTVRPFWLLIEKLNSGV